MSDAAMSARRPSSSLNRRRGAMSTPPPAMRAKHRSTASTASAGASTSRTSASERKSGRRLILLDEADLAVRLENGPLHFVERADLLLPHLLRHLVLGHPLAPEVVVDELPALDDDDRLTFEHLPCAPRTER